MPSAAKETCCTPLGRSRFSNNLGVMSDRSSRAGLRGAVIGGGTMGSLHLRVLRALGQVAEVILVEPDDERRAALEARYRDLRSYLDVETAISRDALDFACVAVPVAEAPAIAARLIEHRG